MTRTGQPVPPVVDALISGRCDDLLAAAGKALADGAARGGGAAGAARAELAAAARLRAAGHPAELVAAAFSQAELRRRAAVKFSRAESMLFTRDGLEQASGEAAARHRAGRFDGLGRLADLCTGVGGDLLALAEGREVIAVDLDETHLRFASHNGGVYGNASGVEPVCADVRDVDLTGVQGAFVDPARRGTVGRGSPTALAAGAADPPLGWCFDLAERLGPVVVKAVPGLDLGIVPDGWEVEFVAEGRDLKESVLVSPALAGAARRATVLPAGWQPAGGQPAGAARRAAGVVSMAGEPDADAETDGDGDGDGRADRRLAVGLPGDYLYDPSPAVTRAGLVGLLGRQLGAWQIDPRIAFLTCGAAHSTPFARLLRICDSVPFDIRRLAALLRTYRLGSLDVRRRGLAGDVETIRRRLLPARRDLVPGGPALTVVMTRLAGRPWALVCTEPPGPPGS